MKIAIASFLLLLALKTTLAQDFYCPMCGDGRIPTLLDVVVNVPTQGNFTCEEIDIATKTGIPLVVDQNLCPLLQGFIEDPALLGVDAPPDPCGCVDTVSPTVAVTDFPSEFPSSFPTDSPTTSSPTASPTGFPTTAMPTIMPTMMPISMTTPAPAGLAPPEEDYICLLCNGGDSANPGGIIELGDGRNTTCAAVYEGMYCMTKTIALLLLES